jgi:GntR family transcriptional regulator, rspAB operon transcriptional repressor
MSDSMTKLENFIIENGAVDATDSRLLHQVAYERLKSAIKLAELQPGELLSEGRIAKALGISRTPVREAIRHLAQEGLLQIIPGRAIAVAAPSIQDVLDGLHIRELLEPELVRLATDSLPANALELLQEMTEKMEIAAQDGDRLAWSKADTIWHEILSNHCPNQLLGRLVLEARNRVVGIVFQDNYYSPYLVQGTQEHREIVDAISAHDGQHAEGLMREHIQEARRNMFKQF